MRARGWIGSSLLAAALALGGCASTGPGVQVTRFFLPQPIARGQIAVEPLLPQDRDSLEFRSYASIVGAELAKQGFTEAPGLSQSEQVAVVSVERASREGPPRGGGLSIGLGGGSFGRGGGIGGGVGIPVTRPRPSLIDATRLVVQIKRRSDSSVVWEGRAETQMRSGAAGADADATVRRLAAALFAGFPGESNRTVVVK